MIDYDKTACNSIKSLVIKKITTVTTRFMNGKMLIFAKVSLMNFIFDIIDVFDFLTIEVLDIYKQNKCIKCLIFLKLTYINSCLI